MSSKYKVGEDAIAHFVTFSVVGWVDVFSRESYKEIFVDSLKHCQENKGLKLHAWVIMTNHVHLIISSETNKLEDIVRDLKKYTSKKITAAIQENPTESRKECPPGQPFGRGCSIFLIMQVKTITTTKTSSSGNRIITP